MINGELPAFILYFAAVLLIGVIFFFKTRGGGEKEYFLGGRTMGPYVTAMSAQASDMSGWLLMGFPGSILAFGLGKAWIGIGLALGTILNWVLVAKRLRLLSAAAGDSITLPQYLSNRFAAKKPTLRVICAAVFLVFFTVYVASSFVAGAAVFTAIFPMDNDLAMGIFAAILILYTFLGGYKAVCWTDFFQGIMMLLALLTIPLAIFFTKDLDYSLLDKVIVGGDGVSYAFTSSLFSASWQDILSGLAWGLGYFGMPHILVRFMGIKDPNQVKKSAAVAIVWVLLALSAAILLSCMGRILVGEELLKTGMQKMVFIELARMLFPGLISGVLMAAIIAASMSTADSQLLVASSAFTADLYKPLLRKQASDKETLWVGRAVVIALSVVAFFIARSKGSGAHAIMNMVENAWGGFGSAFGAVVLLSVFWKRFTYRGAVAGVAIGAAVDVLWLLLFTASTGIYELLPGFLCSMAAAVTVSLLDKKGVEKAAAVYAKALGK